jgi:hypothetical protein
MVAPSAGDRRAGAACQAFVKEWVLHLETPPFFRTARTRHQYFPSWSVAGRVADVLHVWKLPALPRTGELNFLSLATSNS